MATTSYRTRVIIKEFDGDDLSSIDFSGTYKLLMNSKSVPSPSSPPNPVESTGLEDDAQTYEMGIKTSDAKEIAGNLEKEYLDNIDSLGQKRVCVLHLYGTDGIGKVAKYAYVGQISVTVNDVGGVDEIVEMTATIVPNTTSVKCTDAYTVVDNKDGTFTVSKSLGVGSVGE